MVMKVHGNKKKICKFKMQAKITSYEFCLGSVSKDFTKDEMIEISLNGTIHDFFVDHSAIEKKYILNILIYKFLIYSRVFNEKKKKKKIINVFVHVNLMKMDENATHCKNGKC